MLAKTGLHQMTEHIIEEKTASTISDICAVLRKANR